MLHLLYFNLEIVLIELYSKDLTQIRGISKFLFITFVLPLIRKHLGPLMSLLLILIEKPIEQHGALQVDAIFCKMDVIVRCFLNYFFPILFL